VPNTFALDHRTQTSRSHAGGVLLVAFTLAVAQVWFIDRSWQDCQITQQLGYNSSQLLTLGLPALTIVNATGIGLCAAAFGGRRRDPAVRVFLTVVSAMVLLLAVSALLVLFVATPSGASDMACAGGVPSWWPAWLWG
jgi:hypothetical protein